MEKEAFKYRTTVQIYVLTTSMKKNVVNYVNFVAIYQRVDADHFVVEVSMRFDLKVD